jgi:hypothetical protein
LNAALVNNYYDLAIFRFSNHLRTLLSFICAGGLSNFWNNLVEFYFELGMTRNETLRHEWIRMIHLNSILFWCFVLLSFSGGVFIIEVLYLRKSRRVTQISLERID